MKPDRVEPIRTPMGSGERRDLGALAALGVLALAVRLALIATHPDLDCDAYGHFAAGRALTRDPLDLDAHWVWLPLYHYLVALWIDAGLGFTALRILSSIIQLAAPFVLHRWVRVAASQRTATLAAALFTVAPLANALAVSAQAETLFTCLLVAAALALHARRFVLASALLSMLAMMRYEAWGAVAAVGVLLAHRRLARGEPFGRAPVAVILPTAIVAAWVVVRRVHDGVWLAFLTETRSFAGGLRGTTETSALIEAIRLPLLVPLAVFGPALLLALAGLRAAARMERIGWMPTVGVAGFLLASYVGRGALAGERYFTSLTPFVCVLVALGVDALGRRLEGRWRRAPVAVAAVAGIAMVATTAAHLDRNARSARANEASLRADEARVSAPLE